MLGPPPPWRPPAAPAEVLQRIAAPMVGGMVTSTVLTLVVIPTLYYLWRRRGVLALTGATAGGPGSRDG
jgi:copper/silver efflux system protein